MRYAVVERGRRSCGVRLAILDGRLLRATERDTVRNMASVRGAEQGAAQQQLALYFFNREWWPGNGRRQEAEKYPRRGGEF